MKRLEHLTDWLIIILLCVLLGIAFGYGIGRDLDRGKVAGNYQKLTPKTKN